jgi:ribosomal protein S18 acetylase RimI-like enzyme
MENIQILEYNPQRADNQLTKSLIDSMTWCRLFKNREIAKKDLIEEISKWDKYFIAQKDWEILGFISWWPRNLHDRRWEYELFHIGTHTNEKWIGKKLFNTLLEEAKDHYKNLNWNLRKFYLFTWKENENAHSFYEHLWMQLTGVSIDKFWPGKIEFEYSNIFNEHGEKTDSSVKLTKENILQLLEEHK